MKFLILLAVFAISNAVPSDWGYNDGPERANAGEGGPCDEAGHYTGGTGRPTHRSNYYNEPGNVVNGARTGLTAVIGPSISQRSPQPAPYVGSNPPPGWTGYDPRQSLGRLGPDGVHVAGPNGASVSTDGHGGAVVIGPRHEQTWPTPRHW